MVRSITHGTADSRRRTARRRAGRLGAVVGLAGILWLGAASLFVVDVTQYGVVTRFGEVLRVAGAPGLYVKAPFDSVVPLDKRLLYSSPGRAEYLTADKKNVVVRSQATWRISVPQRFLETLRTRERAEDRLGAVILGAVGAVLGRHPFADLVTTGDRPSRIAAMVAEIHDHARRVAAEAYGIDVVHVDIRRLTLPEQNKINVFERMKAERGRIAKRYRSEGALDSAKIIAQADRERIEILAAAYEKAQSFRAEGEAEAMRIYTAAFSRNPTFYKFLRTLQAYEVFLDDSTTIFLPADAEAFGVLRQDLEPAKGKLDVPLRRRGETASSEVGTDLYESEDGIGWGQGDGGPPPRSPVRD